MQEWGICTHSDQRTAQSILFVPVCGNPSHTDRPVTLGDDRNPIDRAIKFGRIVTADTKLRLKYHQHLR